ncbi:hypothetical protein BG011_004726 [Mortierella polycephala]|uniref:Tyrosyl-DNA phosphodiesterase n=1 Tax=Mortierella polycephala TaxID=41804 RepID=A0A9P6Q0R8_9FUNG|nr:hypothetical protein BG011_004726 [Mortierella polycephala]
MDEIKSRKEISEDEDSPSIVDNPIAGNSTATKRPITEDTRSGEPRIKKPRESVAIQYIDSSIRLTTVQRAPSAHNVGCVSLESLIGDADLEFMVQINYMINIDFVMSKVHGSIRDKLKTIVYHGLRLNAKELLDMNTDIRIRYPRITMHKVPVPGIGTHHTKAMLLFYSDNTMQLIIHTANMIEQDWRNKTQAVFTTGRLSKKVQGPGLSTCSFERDLLEYLEHYNNHEITHRISQFDFTGVKGVLVGSVPGKHEGVEKNKWGHLKLRTVLRQQVSIPRDLIQGSKIICQISSIGSLGKCSQDWLKGEFEASLNAHRDKLPGNADLCVIYPTAENVRTSANLSKPAWGELKESRLDIKSYELGVLFFPSLFEEQGESGENIHVQMMNATYDRDRDTIWLADKFFPGQDDFGNVLRR